MGAHSSKDPDDPLVSTSEWWLSQHPPDESPTARYRLPLKEPGAPPRAMSTTPPPGLPTDRYAEGRTTGTLPRVTSAPPAFVPRTASPPINTGGMPTQEQRRVPPPVSVFPRRPAPAEKPGFGIRVLDWLSAWAIKTLALVIAAGLVAWAVGVDRTITDLKRQNQDLRDVQISQQKRLNEAERQATDAKQAAAETGTSNDQLRQRVTQLEEANNPSGS